MSRSKLIIAVIAILLVCAIYFAFFHRSMESFDDVDIAGLPIINYCDVRNSPGKYDGEIVKMRAKIGDLVHGVFLGDLSCDGKFYEDLSDDSRTAVTFYKPKRDEIWEKYKELKGQTRKPADVIAVGRFTHEYPERSDDSISQRTSFHFELFSLEPPAPVR